MSKTADFQVKNGLKCIIVGKKWSKWVKKWSKLPKNWSKIVKNCSKTVKNTHLHAKRINNGQKLK